MNSRKSIEKRNEEFLKSKFGLSVKAWFKLMKSAGYPPPKYSGGWAENNPTWGWCGSVTNALYFSSNLPDGYIKCKNIDCQHFYFINPVTNEVIDLTIYQFEGEFEFDCTYYTRKAGMRNRSSKYAKIIMSKLGVKLDSNKYYEEAGFITKVKSNK